MTRSQFINLAHWRNTKSSHSWEERESEREREEDGVEGVVDGEQE